MYNSVCQLSNTYSEKQVITLQIDGWILQIEIKDDLIENIQLAPKSPFTPKRAKEFSIL